METLGDWIDVAPWRNRRLLLIHCDNGGIVTAATVGDKRVILRYATGIMVAVWPGEWSSSARVITPAERAKVAEKLG